METVQQKTTFETADNDKSLTWPGSRGSATGPFIGEPQSVRDAFDALAGAK